MMRLHGVFPSLLLSRVVNSVKLWSRVRCFWSSTKNVEKKLCQQIEVKIGFCSTKHMEIGRENVLHFPSAAKDSLSVVAIKTRKEWVEETGELWWHQHSLNFTPKQKKSWKTVWKAFEFYTVESKLSKETVNKRNQNQYRFSNKTEAIQTELNQNVLHSLKGHKKCIRLRAFL